MNILLDTHIFLWLLTNPGKIKKERLSLLESYTNNVYLSSISVAELMIKHSIGKIDIQFNPIEQAKNIGLEMIDFTAKEAILLKTLPFHHKDPFDRILICQSIHNDYLFMTNDDKIKQYKCKQF